jgi:flagellar biosynthesis protein FliP
MDLDEDLTFTTQEMGVEEEQVHLLNELKQNAKQNVHVVLGEYLISCLHQNFHLGITIVVGLFVVYVLQVFHPLT